jgi:aerobic carbon-monoxide dehydrogenase small subunit
MAPLDFTLNGRPLAIDVPPATLLVDLLRGPLALTGTHVGCDTAQCGACTVLLDGDAVKSCSLLAEQVRGRRVTTIEGLAPGGGGDAHALHPVQEAFIACHGLQCGFCTPGMVMVATCLLSKTPAPTEAQIVQALEGNLCRCTGYTHIVAAVQRAALAMHPTAQAQGAAA